MALHIDWTIVWSSTVELVVSPIILTNILLGLVIGSTYGWQSRSEVFTLAATGIGFITAIVVFNLFDPVAGSNPGLVIGRGGIGRAILWTLTCVCIVIGQRFRLRLETRRAKTRIARARAAVEEHHAAE